jgi:hypothetical protein
MKRRHLFDHGYPTTAATMLAGSEVLLAISRQAVRLSRQRIGRSYLLLAAAGVCLPSAMAERWSAR